MPRAATKPLGKHSRHAGRKCAIRRLPAFIFIPIFCSSSVDKGTSGTQRQPLRPHFCMRFAAFVFVWREQTIVWWEQTIVWWGQTIVWWEQTIAREEKDSSIAAVVVQFVVP